MLPTASARKQERYESPDGSFVGEIVKHGPRQFVVTLTHRSNGRIVSEKETRSDSWQDARQIARVWIEG